MAFLYSGFSITRTADEILLELVLDSALFAGGVLAESIVGSPWTNTLAQDSPECPISPCRVRFLDHRAPQWTITDVTSFAREKAFTEEGRKGFEGRVFTERATERDPTGIPRINYRSNFSARKMRTFNRSVRRQLREYRRKHSVHRGTPERISRTTPRHVIVEMRAQREAEETGSSRG